MMAIMMTLFFYISCLGAETISNTTHVRPLSTDEEKMLDALRDLRIKHLEHCKAKDATAFQELYNTAKEQVTSKI